ncbi:ribosomal protein S18 acetylase RimI-like enzyme [Nocardioides daedukensis]|uniref:Ribosomal protein S18 acetylase RimI-like enzyme n=1 Tax=Nocardioides daedukensis TaxID=634462 RepID=A0A7Y9S6A1_9ACTN|nr:GNAT family N-acetyltransferase [Nocardioides daedukensis]NYG60549.1 ribosomal protein S18 acetylase RimI-like enzyme [Nocardioides daedukensis]
MRVRLAEPSEYAALGELTAAAYADFTLGPADPYVDKLRDARARAKEAELWVASDDSGTLLGCVTWCPPGSVWREISRPGEGEFRMLAVSPSAQGQGVGVALAEHCIALSRADGDSAMVLSSLPGMAAAHRLYARLGFERLPERDWSPVPGVELIAFRLGY